MIEFASSPIRIRMQMNTSILRGVTLSDLHNPLQYVYVDWYRISYLRDPFVEKSTPKAFYLLKYRYWFGLWDGENFIKKNTADGDRYDDHPKTTGRIPMPRVMVIFCHF